MNPSHEFVKTALRIGALELLPEGRPLKSGRVSPYFFNSGLFHTGFALHALIEAYADRFVTHRACDARRTVLFGPAYKGIPLVSALAMHLAFENCIDVGYAFDRKEEKDHGEGGVLVGHPFTDPDAVVDVIIVDDVITSGSSIDEAVSFIHRQGGAPTMCLIAFDRQECGLDTNLSAVQEIRHQYHIPVIAAATLQDLIDVLTEDAGKEFPLGPSVLPKIHAYREQYGMK